jgi:hypothetical protein
VIWRIFAVSTVLCCTIAASSSAHCDEADLKAWHERIAREWPGLVQQSVRVIAEHCAGGQVPTKVLSPKLLYRGSIDDVSVSSTGVVAVADLSKGLVLLFQNPDSREAFVQIPIGGGFGGSAGFSANGRYLAWSSGFETYIYDVRSRRFALTVQGFQSHGMEWTGEDLLVKGYDGYNLNLETTSLFSLNGGAFERKVLDTMVFGRGHIPTGASSALPNEDNFALADQFGRSLLSTKRGLYPSFEAAIRDGADISVHKDTTYSERVYRIGDRLVQPDTNGNLFRKPDVPWSLLLRDGTTGSILKSVPLPMPWCVPDQLSVAGDQSQIAMLTKFSVLILDPTDLSARAVYGLDAPEFTMPESIALAPDSTLVVWATSSDLKSSSVFVYKLPN